MTVPPRQMLMDCECGFYHYSDEPHPEAEAVPPATKLAQIEAHVRGTTGEPILSDFDRDVLALVEIAKAAQDASATWKDQRRFMPHAVNAIDAALARLDGAA